MQATYGTLLRIFRQRAKLTQEQLAEKLHISRTTVTKYERDRQPIDLHTFIEWVRVTESQKAAAMLVSGVDIPTIIYQILQATGVA